MIRREIEREMKNKLYSEVLTYEADALEKELQGFEKDPDWAHEVSMKRAKEGHKGFNNMSADEIEDYMCYDEEVCNLNYIDTLVEFLSKEEYSAELSYLIESLQKRNLLPQPEGKQEEHPRQKALACHLRDINEYQYIARIEEQKEAYFMVKYIDPSKDTGYKVLTEQECIKELAEWYEDDITFMAFQTEEISEVLGVSEEMLEVFGLLEDVSYGVGNGTEHLYQMLKKAGKLEELAAKAKANDFCYLADDDNVTKIGDYYVMEAGCQIV